MKPFLQTIEKTNVMLVVDALNLGFRWKHSGQEVFAEEYIDVVNSLARSYKARYVVIAADKGKSSYRLNIYPEYKSDRAEKFASQTEEEKQAFERFFKEYHRTLELLAEQYPVLTFQGCEADDIAAYITQIRKSLGVEHIWLVSSDKDWDLLIGKNVSRFSYVTRKETTLDTWSSMYKCPMEQYLDYKCLVGDVGDSIPGVDGVGPVKAVSLLNTYGSIYEIIAALPITSKYVYINNLNKFGAENLERNIKLMDLLTYCKEALGDNVVTIKQTLQEYVSRN